MKRVNLFQGNNVSLSKLAIAFYLVLSVSGVDILVNGTKKASAADIITNGGFLFNFPGHTDGDNGSHATIVNDSSTVPNWTSTTGIAVTDPQFIFDFTTEYIQVQTSSSVQDLYQYVTLDFNSSGSLTMETSRRNDNLSTDGIVFLELYSGHLSSFSPTNLINPDVMIAPSLSGTIQTYSNTYNTLLAGDYTVRIGGQRNSGLFQAGIDNVVFDVNQASETTPEPSSILSLLTIGGIVLGASKKKQD